MSDQLVFEWPQSEGLKAQDFFVADPNAHAVEMLRDHAAWPEQKLILVGPEASGKSHLSRIFSDSHDAEIYASSSVPIHYQGHLPIVIEDADQIPADQQESLFHLHNNLRASNIPLLLTARAAPGRWPVTLPDLSSRMEATATVQINEPDDTLLQVLLTKLFTDRQIMPSPNVINYVAARMDRTYVAAQQVVDQLDRMALAEKKPISMKMAAALLDK